MPGRKMLPAVGTYRTPHQEIPGRSRVQLIQREAINNQARGANRSQARHLKGKPKDHRGAVRVLFAQSGKRRLALERIPGSALTVILLIILDIKQSLPHDLTEPIMNLSQRERKINSSPAVISHFSVLWMRLPFSLANSERWCSSFRSRLKSSPYSSD